jgi:hypothetical protein
MNENICPADQPADTVNYFRTISEALADAPKLPLLPDEDAVTIPRSELDELRKKAAFCDDIDAKAAQNLRAQQGEGNYACGDCGWQWCSYWHSSGRRPQLCLQISMRRECWQADIVARGDA